MLVEDCLFFVGVRGVFYKESRLGNLYIVGLGFLALEIEARQ